MADGRSGRNFTVAGLAAVGGAVALVALVRFVREQHRVKRDAARKRADTASSPPLGPSAAPSGASAPGGAAALPAADAAAAAAAAAGAGGRRRSMPGTEDPWRVSEGDRNFALGKTVTLPATMAVTQLLLLEVPSLRALLPESDAAVRNVRHAATWEGAPGEYLDFVDESGVVIGDIVRNVGHKQVSRAFCRAGPRESLYFNPRAVRAAIATCGGLCPGLNNVIRELVETLHFAYGVETIYGVQHGYWGFHTPDADLATPRSPNAPRGEPPLLTPASVDNIHNFGGTVLGADRGGHDVDVILRFCETRGVNQLYIIGGDGTHRGADALYRASAARGVPLAVCAIPKTIDNDVDIIDRSFGFDTAYSEAQVAIKTAKVEAAGAVNGIGIVKLMGRFAGFVAAHATLASGDVDLCLIPEVPIVLAGRASILDHLAAVVKRKGHAVVVVAEGAGEEQLNAEIVAAGGVVECDAGGNKKLPPIGPWLQGKITAHFKSIGVPVHIKYIDPSYMIRSVPANPADAVLCTLLAQAGVHGAMAGFTGFSCGLTNNRLVYLPITAITANSPRRLNPRGRTFERILSLTRQPDPLADAVGLDA